MEIPPRRRIARASCPGFPDRCARTSAMRSSGRDRSWLSPALLPASASFVTGVDVAREDNSQRRLLPEHPAPIFHRLLGAPYVVSLPSVPTFPPSNLQSGKRSLPAAGQLTTNAFRLAITRRSPYIKNTSFFIENLEPAFLTSNLSTQVSNSSFNLLSPPHARPSPRGLQPPRLLTLPTFSISYLPTPSAAPRP